MQCTEWTFFWGEIVRLVSKLDRVINTSASCHTFYSNDRSAEEHFPEIKKLNSKKNMGKQTVSFFFYISQMFPGNQCQQWLGMLKAEVVAVTWNEQWYFYMMKVEKKVWVVKFYYQWILHTQSKYFCRDRLINYHFLNTLTKYKFEESSQHIVLNCL